MLFEDTAEGWFAAGIDICRIEVIDPGVNGGGNEFFAQCCTFWKAHTTKSEGRKLVATFRVGAILHVRVLLDYCCGTHSSLNRLVIRIFYIQNTRKSGTGLVFANKNDRISHRQFVPMKNHLRTFIAVSLPPSVQTGIGKLIRSLQSHGDGVSWVETRNLHITLKFLGDTPLNDLPQLIHAVTQSIQQTDSFDLTLHGIGVFPNWESPKTIWIGCREGSEELRQLAEKIGKGLIPLGFPMEARKFSPHLTIGRIKKVAVESSLMSMLAEQKDCSFGSRCVDEVQIISSELTRKGPLYDELAAIPLR